jgi:hypothetical protein
MVDIAQWRERLQSRINSFDQQATEFWVPESFDVSLDGPNYEEQDIVPSDSEDEFKDEENVFLLSLLKDLLCPETVALLLPSNIGLQACQDAGYMTFVRQEQQLRIGQANDALQGL